MTEPQPLGDYIRERRLALGFSAGQLAMRLASTAAVVRTWERGHDPVPEEAFAGLADLLDVAESHLRSLQPVEEIEEASEVEAPTPTMAIDEEADVVDESDIQDSGVEVDETGDKDEAGDDADGDDDRPEPVAADPGETTEPAEQGPVAAVPPGMGMDTAMLEAPTEAIEPVRALQPAAAAVSTAQRTPPASDPVAPPPSVEPAATEVDGSVPAWLGPFKVFFDPEKRYLYWARWIGTAIGLYILLRILGFGLDGLVESIGDFWDSFRTPEGPAVEGGIESLRFLG